MAKSSRSTLFRNHCLAFLFLCIYLCSRTCLAAEKKSKQDDDEEGANSWKRKDIRDYSDADMERLLEQWEVIMEKIIVLSLGYKIHYTRSINK